jgi:hypothetical protein
LEFKSIKGNLAFGLKFLLRFVSFQSTGFKNFEASIKSRERIFCSNKIKRINDRFWKCSKERQILTKTAAILDGIL